MIWIVIILSGERNLLDRLTVKDSDLQRIPYAMNWGIRHTEAASFCYPNYLDLRETVAIAHEAYWPYSREAIASYSLIFHSWEV
jgi:hypothetical protein